jgi:6-pyruvoyltetrahydropterin/6-carboxytetrahydropterin synthase
MFRVFKETEFSAAHSLREYKGRCENLHGHNWKVRLQVAAKELDSLGMVIDFQELKRILAVVTGRLDHQNLNNIEPFHQINPTSENIAKYICQETSKMLSSDKVKVEQVMVWEKSTSCAVYEAE